MQTDPEITILGLLFLFCNFVKDTVGIAPDSLLFVGDTIPTIAKTGCGVTGHRSAMQQSAVPREDR
jgi:hypothetical protein